MTNIIHLTDAELERLKGNLTLQLNDMNDVLKRYLNDEIKLTSSELSSFKVNLQESIDLMVTIAKQTGIDISEVDWR